MVQSLANSNDDLSALPKRIAGKLFGNVVSILREKYRRFHFTGTEIAAGKISVATIFVRFAVSACSHFAFRNADAFCLIEPHE
jgi:hypothetical protein